MLRTVRWLVCLGTVLLCLAARAETVVTVWGLAITPEDKGNDAVVRAFEQANPGIKIRLLGMGAGGMNPQKLMTAIVGGAPPDLIRQDRFTIADWASRGAFRSLDDLIARDATDPLCPKPDQYYKATWDEVLYDGQVYGIPVHADDRVLYYNTKVFQEQAPALRAAGLDPDRPPRTWSEALAYSKVLTQFNKDGTLKRAGFMPNYGNSWLYMYAFQNNAPFMTPDGKTCTLNSPEVLEALQFMVDGYKLLGGYDNAVKFEKGFGSGELDPFAVGQIAMAINGDWQVANYARSSPNAQFRTAPAPVPDDRYYRRGRFKNEPDQFITWSGGFSWAMPRGGKNVEAAWKFLKWMTSLEGRKVAAAAQADMERARGRKYIPRMEAQIAANEFILGRYVTGDDQYTKAIQTHADMMRFARTRPGTSVAQKLWDEHVRALEQAGRGAVTPEVALREGQNRVQALLDEIAAHENYPTVDVSVPVGLLFLATVLAGVGWIAFRFKKGTERVSRQETLAGYAFVSPWIIGFLLFTLGPMVASFVFAFMQYDVLNEARFVGPKNFVDVFGTDRDIVFKSFWNVGYLAVIGIPLGIATGLGIAMLLNTGVRGMRYFRTAFYLPSITPGVAATILWIWLFLPDNSRGLVNNLWSNSITQWFGIAAPGWLNAEAWAKPALIIMGLWGAGSGMVLWLAGLKGIPQTLYEAAGIDGASPWRQFTRITLPQLSPLIFFSSVMSFIAVLQTFDSVFIATSGLNMGPNDSMATPVYLLFNNAFAYFRMGYASALAWVIFLIVVFVTWVQFRLAPRWVHSEVGPS